MSHAPIPRGAIIGIVGNGPFGRMIAHAAREVGYRTWVFGPGSDSPAGQVADRQFDAEYSDPDALGEFLNGADVITFGCRQVPRECLTSLRTSKPIHPTPEILLLTQNPLHERNWLLDRGFPIPDFISVRSRAELDDALEFIGTPAILRGCDGEALAGEPVGADLDAAWSAMGCDEAVLEAHLEGRLNLSACCTRSSLGETRCFPVCENTFDREALVISRAPAEISPDLAQKAQALVLQIAQSARIVGTITIELSLVGEDTLLINRFTAAPHASGQLSIDAYSSSLFKHHVLAITGRPLPKVDQREPAMTVSLLGALWDQEPPPFDALMALPGARLHIYGETESAPRREMGHLTVVGDVAPHVMESLHRLALEQSFYPPQPPSAAEVITGRLAQRPFQPFSISLSDGRTLLIDEAGALATLRHIFVHQSTDGSVTQFKPDDISAIS